MTVALMSRAESSHGACTLCQAPLPIWKHVPVDAWKRDINRHADAYWCTRCGYGSVQPMPSSLDISEFYRFDDYYTHCESAALEMGETAFLDRLRVHLAWRLDRGKPLTESHVHRALSGKLSRICDLGCGNGELLLNLSDLGHTVVGVEVDPEAVSPRLRNRAKQSFEVFRGTAESLPEQLAGRSFDCVILRHVLEHCREPMRALRNAHELLAPGGILMCEVPNNEAWGLQVMGCAWAMFDMPRHLHFFTRQSLMQVCERAGFQIQEPFFANYHRQFNNAWIESERDIWDKLMGLSSKPNPQPACNSRWQAWKQLCTSAFMPAGLKYDSVGVIAVRAP
jgi:2-polyprenyl-3-methyl-5-hydroxy-6-metoxy-1,4-benzoquinol methylase